MKRNTGRCGSAMALTLAATLAAVHGTATVAVAAQDPTAAAPSGATLEQRNVDLQRRLDQMQQQLDALKRDAGPAAAATTPATGVLVPATVLVPAGVIAPTGGPAVAADVTDRRVGGGGANPAAAPAATGLPADVTAGYKNGFFLKQGDEFSLTASGVFDVRYSYTDARNKTALTTTPLGANHQRAESGFSLYNGQLTLNGELFKHGQSEAFFKATGNFGTFQSAAGTPGGTFFLDELYGGYAVNNALKVRAGAMIIPFTPFTSLTLNGGLTFPNVTDAIIPYLTGFAIGADVGGSLFNDTVSYDLAVTNGSTGQGLTNSTSVLSGRDNRVAFYTREQVCGSGKLSDFLDESDVQDHKDFVWVLGAGFGYESQNDTPTAFPGPQSTLRLQGVSSATGAGFRPASPVNGDAYRYVLDLRAKLHGFSFVGEGLYQNFANETNAPIVPGYPRHSIGQTALTAQVGYFLVPHHLEVAGRLGQLYTNGLRHQMDEWTFGVNYYLYGENLKLQIAETYVPRQAALTSNTGLLINTQDWLTQAQVQLKF